MPATVVHPIAKVRGSGYGPRTNPVTGRREHHNGDDYPVPLRTPIYAPTDGVVVEGKDRAADTVDGFGNWIWIDAQRAVGKDFIFGHLEHRDILVRGGDRVKAGDLIGYVGSAGQSTGPHLHFEVWSAPGRLGGKALDPAAWLARAGATEPLAGPTPAKPSTGSKAQVPSPTKGNTVATAADVQNELEGTDTGHAVEVYGGFPTELGRRTVRSIQDKVGILAWDLTRGHTQYDEGLPGTRGPVSLWDSVKRILRENTSWLPRRGLTTLAAKVDQRDTLRGDAKDAVSYAAANHALLKAIASANNVDVATVLAPFQNDAS